MTYSWTNNLLDGGALLENTPIAPLATLTASDGGVDAVSYGISDGSDGYGNVLFAIDDNGVLSPTSYLNDYENSFLDYSESRHFTALVNAYSAEGDVVASRLFVLTLQDVDEFDTKWGGTLPTGISIDENNPENHRLAAFYAVDGDGSAGVTYSLSGDDAAYFTTAPFGSVGGLYLKSSLDYEDSSHADGLYSVIVTATSTDGSDAISTLYVLTVVDVNEPVEWQTNPTGNADVVLENIAVGASVADFDAINPEGTGTVYGLGAYHDGFGLDGGSQGQYFNIDADTGVITTKSALDFETQEHYTLNVLSQASPTDDKPLGVGVISQIFVLTITDVNEFDTEWVGTPPTGIAIKENNPENRGLGDFYATDGDGSAGVTYSLSGDDAAYFTTAPFDDIGVLYAKSSFNFEDPDHADGLYSVIVTATSTDGSDAISTLYVLTVVDVNEAVEWQTNPTGNAGEVLENIAIGTALATFSATDPEGAGVMYGLGAYHDGFGLDGGSQGQYFNIDADTGVITTKSALDFETQEHYTLNVLSQADDNPMGEGGIMGMGVISQIFVLTITDVEDTAPSEPTAWQNNGNPSGAALAENNSIGTSLADFGATDGNGVAVTYSLSGADNAYFEINTATGVLMAKSQFDFENNDHGTLYSVTINATSTDDSPVISSLFILTVGDVNNTNDWNSNTLTGKAIDENRGAGLNLWHFRNDGDLPAGVTMTYAISGDAVDYFTITNDVNVFGNFGRLRAKNSFDYESDYGQSIDNRYSVIITANATEEGTAISRTYILTVGDVSNTPDWASNIDTGMTRNENRTNTTLWDFRNDEPLPDGVSITYGLSGDNADRFTISPRDGGDYWRFRGGGDYDYESDYGQSINNRYSVIITANATEEGTAISRTYILTIGDVGNTPDWNSDTPTGKAIDENNGTESLWTFDNDGAPRYVDITYGISGENTTYFGINTRSGFLRVKDGLDYESDYGQSIDNRYSVIVTANVTSGEALAISRTYILTVNDVGNTPDWNSDTPTGKAIDENNGTESLWTFDNDGAPRYVDITYGISGENTTYFGINTRSGFLRVKDGLDYESDYGQSIDNRYSVIVTANVTSGEAVAISRTYILTVNDVSNTGDWRSDYHFNLNYGNLDENSGANFDVGTFDTWGTKDVTYGLSGRDVDYFSINKVGTDGRAALRTTEVFDYESEYGQSINNRYEVVIHVNATTEGTAKSRLFVLNINDDPSNNTTDFTAGDDGKTIAENNSVGFNPGDRITDFGNSQPAGINITYGLSGEDANYFNIHNRHGWLFVASTFDYESQDGIDHNNRYSVVVHANADFEGTEISRLFILTIDDVNNTHDWGNNHGITPRSGRDINENWAAGTTVYYFQNYGALPSGVNITYDLKGDTEHFAIDANSGIVKTTFSFDYEDQNVIDHNHRYSLVVHASADFEGDAISRVFVVTIADIDYTPVWTDIARPWRTFDSGNNRIENRGLGGAPLADFDTVTSLPDPYQITYGLSSYVDDDGKTINNTKYFKINRKSGVLVERSNFDYEDEYGQSIDNRYSVAVTANANGGGESEQISRIFILTIDDRNYTAPWTGNPPKGANILENNRAGVQVADFDNPSPLPWIPTTYGLEGDAADYFNIHETNGRLTVISVLDYESEYGQSIDNRYIFTITANAKTNTGEGTQIRRTFILTVTDVDESGGLAPDPTTPDQPVGLNGKILFDGTTETIGGVNDGIGNEGLIIIGNDLVATQYSDGAETNLVINNVENFEQSFVGYTDADGNDQNHWFFVRDDAGDNTGHIVFDADGLDVNLESLANGGATTTPDQINLLAGLNFGSDGDFNKPDDLNLDLNGNNAASLTHDQFLALIGGSNNIDFI